MKVGIVPALWVAFASSAGSAAGEWKPQLVPSPDGSVQDVVFPLERTGWICGFFAGVLRTNDGGSTWKELKSNLTTERIGSIWFLDSTRGWAAATSYAGSEPRQVILSTTDGGVSWAVRYRVEGGVVHLVSIWFFNERMGWAVGARDNKPLIVSTSDGGRTWKEAYIAGDGRTWKDAFIKGELTPEIRRIRFADTSHGWAIGPGAIFYTSDGGITWTPQYVSGDGVWLNGLAVLSPKRVWAVGGRGFLLRTIDRGATWSRVSLPEKGNDFLWAIAFAGWKDGWIGGAGGVILSTRDGGDTWERAVSPVHGVLVDVAVTSSRVFITGDSSRVIVWQR
jgi:photosystem II stability/assembly factor-like uncharacterized protein